MLTERRDAGTGDTVPCVPHLATKLQFGRTMLTVCIFGSRSILLLVKVSAVLPVSAFMDSLSITGRSNWWQLERFLF